MLIRSHHALCAQFFEGKGYSERFVGHMYQILAALETENDAVTLAEGCDAICEGCPNKKDGQCTSFEKVRGIDERAAKTMGLKAGDTLNWQELIEKAKSAVILAGRLTEVCQDCEWIALCSGKARLMVQDEGKNQ